MTRRVMIDPDTKQIVPEYLLPAHKAKAAGVREVRVIGIFPNDPTRTVLPSHLLVEAPDGGHYILTITPVLRQRIIDLADAHGFDLSTYDTPDLRKIGLRPQQHRINRLEFWDPFPLLPT